jgi:N-ethylmaleimide reductase
MENRSSAPIFTPFKLGDLQLKNRMAMASLTRQRADYATGVANDMHVEYYSKRADCGIMFTECSSIRPDGNCFPGSAGIYSDEQVEAWKKVTDAVHEKGGVIFLQIWHAGRAAHPDHIGGQTPVAPSAIAINDTVYT